MGKRFSLVMTTINVPIVLDAYTDNFERFGYKDEVSIIVIPDLKTPPEAREVMARLARRGFDVDYVELERQEEWLSRFPDLAAIIPYNSDNRRNIGYLMALERGCEILLSIDDDNYCLPDDDFCGGHSIVGTVQTRPTISTNTGWFNICALMETSNGGVIYPRGYPYSKRVRNEVVDEKLSSGYVAVNAGLWIDDPDVDAITRLHEDVKALRIKREPVLLGRTTQSPVNTQNTALVAEAIAAYYFVLMGEKIDGSVIDRYGDIWSGYFLGKCVAHMGHHIGVGRPVVSHKRNRHNLFKDLQQELWGMILTESLVRMMERIELEGNTYLETYRDLSWKLEKAFDSEEDVVRNTAVRAYFLKITRAMRIWADVCASLSPQIGAAKSMT